MCCRTSVPAVRSLQVSARTRVYLPSLFPEAPVGCAGSELQQDSRKAVFQQRLRAVAALSVAGSVSGIRILLCSPHLALLQSAYFYPCSFFLLCCPWGRELHPRKGSLMSGSEVLLLSEPEQGWRFSGPIGVG